MDMKELKEQVLSLPEAIKKQELGLLESAKLLKENQLRISLEKGNILREVSEEKLDGKAKFSNKDARELEVNKRMADTQKGVLDAIEKQKIDIRREEIELGFLKRSFQSYGHLSRLGVE